MAIGISLPEILIAIFFGIAGLCAGSFASAIIYRENKNLPWFQLKGQHTRSVCTSCGTELKFYDLFPVLSWIKSKGKCRYCGNTVSYLYPLTELLCCFLAVLIFVWSGLGVISVTVLCCLPFLVSLIYLGLVRRKFSLRLVTILFTIGVAAFILQLIFSERIIL